MPYDPETALVDERRPRRAVLPWLLVIALAGGAGYGYFALYRPLDERADRKEAQAADLEQKLKQARAEVDAAKAAKADLQKAQDDLKQMREDLARSAAQKSEDDRLLAELKKEVGAGGAEVNGDAGRITVTMVDKILFKSGESDLTPQGEDVLRKLGAVLKTVDKTIQVSGHADNTPVKSDLKDLYPTNWELSTARATNVVRFLQDEVGIKPRRMMAAGYGSYRPIASNATANGRARNRRIEILLLPEKMKVVKGDFSDELASAAPAKGAKKDDRPKDRDRVKAAAAARAKGAAAKDAGAKKKSK
jgi:chemotaxis protein MotB